MQKLVHRIDFINGFGAGGGSRTHTGIRPTDFKSGMSTIPSRPHLALFFNFQFRAYIGPENSLLVATPCSVCISLHRRKDFKSGMSTIPSRPHSGNSVWQPMRLFLALCLPDNNAIVQQYLLFLGHSRQKRPWYFALIQVSLSKCAGNPSSLTDCIAT